MNNTATRWTDHQIETVIGNLLRAGVLVAGAVVAFGAAIFFARHGREIPHYRIFVGEPAELRSVRGIVAQAASLYGRNIIQLGLLFLIATPVARVAFSVVAFALERDRLYIGVTLIVLAVLLFSLTGGHV
jgi:uncharacterized membrane protein